MIVLLVSLSVLSVGISNSGYKLSQRMGNQFKEYYLLESEADRCYSEIVKWKREDITPEKMAEIGCLRSYVGEATCSFHVERNGRSFYVVLDLGHRDENNLYPVLSWYEAEQRFEIKELEVDTFQK